MRYLRERLTYGEILPGLLLATLILTFSLLMAGCQTAPLAPQGLSQSLGATEIAATTARQSGLVLGQAGKINKAQAQFVNNQADAVREGVTIARGMLSTNPAGAQNQYLMTVQILTALQTFLATYQGK